MPLSGGSRARQSTAPDFCWRRHRGRIRFMPIAWYGESVITADRIGSSSQVAQQLRCRVERSSLSRLAGLSLLAKRRSPTSSRSEVDPVHFVAVSHPEDATASSPRAVALLSMSRVICAMPVSIFWSRKPRIRSRLPNSPNSTDTACSARGTETSIPRGSCCSCSSARTGSSVPKEDYLAGSGRPIHRSFSPAHSGGSLSDAGGVSGRSRASLLPVSARVRRVGYFCIHARAHRVLDFARRRRGVSDLSRHRRRRIRCRPSTSS